MGEDEVAICPNHNGRILRGMSQGDYYGKRYWCPIGRKHWQLTERSNAMTRRLPYPKTGVL